MSLDESLTYEQALAQLDATLHALEEGKLSLEEAIAAVARGREYRQLCERKLEEARQRIESLPVRQQLVDGDAVEGRDLVQAGDRDIPVAALVGGQQRPLEALIRKDFDLLKRQAALLAQTPQSGPNFSRVPVQWIPLDCV